MNLKPLVAACAAFASFASLAATELTVVNFGGANGNAQKIAYFGPYEKATGNKVVAVEYNGEQAKIKAMVEAKKVTWDVVEVESPDVTRVATKVCLRSSTTARLATRPTSPRLPCMNAVSAPLCGRPSWPTTATSSRPHPPPGLTSGT
jgi:hypothetical protein